MLGGIHFFFGSAIAISATKNYFFAFLLGIFTHHFLDFLPHLDTNVFNGHKYRSLKDWDKKVWFLVISEFFLFFLLTFYFLGNLDFEKQKIGFLGGIGGIFPDLFTLFMRTFLPDIKIFNFYLNFHKDFHYQFNKKYISPILSQILIFLLALILFWGI